jgi:hypothetical protein
MIQLAEEVKGEALHTMQEKMQAHIADDNPFLHPSSMTASRADLDWR